MSSAVIASVTPTLLLLSSIASIKLCLTPRTTTSSTSSSVSSCAITNEKGIINNNDNKYLFTEFSPFYKKQIN